MVKVGACKQKGARVNIQQKQPSLPQPSSLKIIQLIWLLLYEIMYVCPAQNPSVIARKADRNREIKRIHS